MKLSNLTTAALLLAVASLGACKKDEGATPPAPTTGAEAPAAPAAGTEAPAAGTTNTEAGHH